MVPPLTHRNINGPPWFDVEPKWPLSRQAWYGGERSDLTPQANCVKISTLCLLSAGLWWTISSWTGLEGDTLPLTKNRVLPTDKLWKLLFRSVWRSQGPGTMRDRSTVSRLSALEEVLSRILIDSIQQIEPSRLGCWNRYEEIIGCDELFLLMDSSPIHSP